MNRDVVLALDNGTQSVRALLFDPQGKLLDKAKVDIEPYVSPEPGWAEQSPTYYWDKLCEACQLLWSKTAVPKSAIAGVAVTTQRGTVVNVDKGGRPLRPAIVWLDQRRTAGQKPVSGLWGAAFRLTNMSETVAYLQAEAEANWIRVHQPEIWQQTHKYLLLSGYLNYRLSGRFIDSIGSQVAYIPFDYKNLDWCKPRDWKWQAVPMPKSFLPELVPPATIMGEITPQAAEATGIPVGLPLVAAAADKACEVIGSGALEPHVGCLSYGTTATINTTHQKYTEVIPLIPPYPSAVPDAYSLEVQIYRGFWMVNWFKQEFGLRERQMAEDRGVVPEALFDELVA
ncbi:MAG: carbohydrate kinase, partial [Chloroflexi bacterium]|nr:carbohydrate kinase [Chloroflexota bacterium]